MKNGNVFSQWLKEFCALVFTQSVQAFLLAIILTMVVLILSQDTGTDNVTTNQAAGVLAIIALASISKMEELIKKLFGISSSITDASMQGGKGGVLGTIAAMQMAKKALNNAPKVAQGVHGRIKASGDKKKAELDREKALNKAKDRFKELHGSGAGGGSGSGGGAGGGSGSGGGAGGGSGSGGGAGGGSGSGGGAGGSSGSGSGAGGSSGSGGGAGGGSGSGGGAGGGAGSSGKDHDKYIRDKHKLQDELDRIESEYKKKQEEIKQNKRTARRNIASGLTETAGALMGGAAGAVYGLGTGQDVIKSAGIGVGVGDTIGKAAVDIPAKINDIGMEYKDLYKNTKDYNKKLKAKNDELTERLRNFDVSDI